MSKGALKVDLGLIPLLLVPIGLLGSGAVLSFETMRFLKGSASASAVVTKMADSSSDQGWHSCAATIEFVSRDGLVHARLDLGGYWPETESHCMNVGEKVDVEYSVMDPTDARAVASLWDKAIQLLVIGGFFSLIYIPILIVHWPSRKG